MHPFYTPVLRYLDTGQAVTMTKALGIMDLCAVCQTIDIRDLLESFHNSEQFSGLLRGRPSNESKYLRSTNYQPHQPSLAALREAGESGCGLCGMIWARHCREQAKHGNDDCTCKRYPGPVRIIMYQHYNHSFALLGVLVSRTGEQDDPNAGHLTELQISTAKGMLRSYLSYSMAAANDGEQADIVSLRRMHTSLPT